MESENYQEYKERPIEILPATSEDARGIHEVFYKTWLATYPNEEAGVTRDDIEDMYKDAFTDEALQKRVEWLERPPEGVKVLIAKDGERVIGVCTAIKREAENQLQTIYVLPEYQGRGIGTMLWQESEKFFDPEKDTVIDVADYNANAIKFYEKLGFADSGKPHRQNERFKMKSGAMISEMEMRKRRETEN